MWCALLFKRGAYALHVLIQRRRFKLRQNSESLPTTAYGLDSLLAGALAEVPSTIA